MEILDPSPLLTNIPSIGGLVYKKAWEIEDEKSGMTDNQRTMREFRSIANSLIPFIRVTSDRPNDNEGKEDWSFTSSTRSPWDLNIA